MDRKEWLRIRRELSASGRRIKASRRKANAELLDCYYSGSLGPKVESILNCDAAVLCESLPLILSALALLPLWLKGMQSEMYAAIRERVKMEKSIGQCLHFLIQSEFITADHHLYEKRIHDHCFLDESLWQSIAVTLLASPAGFRLQVPRKIFLYDPFLLSQVSYIQVERVFASNTRPLLLSLHGRNSSISRLIYKEGDDLRQDMGILQVFKAMNMCWQKKHTKTRIGKQFISIATYGVSAFSTKIGCIELVQGVRALTEVKGSDRFTKKQLDILIATAAGGYLGAHILGIRDRHSDNVLLADDGKCIHIDFGHILDDKVALDTDFFATTPEFRKALGAERWSEFCDSCVDAFLALRESSEFLIEISATIFQSIANKVKVKEVISRGLLLQEYPDDTHLAAKRIRQMVQNGPDAVFTRLKNQVHAIAVKRIPSTHSHRPPPAIATGFLYKRGEGAGSGWRHRFFALLPPLPQQDNSTGYRLYYFTSEAAWFSMRDDGTSSAHKGLIELDAVQAIHKVQVILDDNDKDDNQQHPSAPSKTGMPHSDGTASDLHGDRRTVHDLSTMKLRVSSPRLLSRTGSASSSSSSKLTFTATNNLNNNNDDSFRFALVTPTRTWHLRAENTKDFYRWAALLAKHTSPSTLVSSFSSSDDEDNLSQKGNTSNKLLLPSHQAAVAAAAADRPLTAEEEEEDDDDTAADSVQVEDDAIRPNNSTPFPAVSARQLNDD